MELKHLARQVVFHQDVRFGSQLVEYLHASLRFHVNANTLLVSVHAQEVRTLPALLRVQKRRTPSSCIVTASRPFHLDHLGAKVGEDHGGKGAGQHPGQVEHFDPLERAGGGCLWWGGREGPFGKQQQGLSPHNGLATAPNGGQTLLGCLQGPKSTIIQVADSCPAMFGGELGSTVSTGGGCQLFPRIVSVRTQERPVPTVTTV